MRLGKHKRRSKRKKLQLSQTLRTQNVKTILMNTQRSVTNIKNQHTMPPKHLKSSTDAATQTKPDLSWKKWTKKVKAFFFIYSILQAEKKEDRSIPAGLKKNCLLCNSAGENICSLLSHAHLCCCQETVQAALGMASLCYSKRVKYFTKIQNYYDLNIDLHFET